MTSTITRPRPTMLILWAVADVLSTVAAVGRYEDDITGSTHGQPDLWLPWMVFQVMTPFGPILLWWITFIGAVITLIQFRESTGWRPTFGWTAAAAAAVFVQLLTWGYLPLTAHRGGLLHETFVDRRTFAYPLWMIATASVLLVVVLSVRQMRRPVSA